MFTYRILLIFMFDFQLQIVTEHYYRYECCKALRDAILFPCESNSELLQER